MNNLRIINDCNDFDFKFIHRCLVDTYWAQGRPFAIVEKSFRNSVSRMLYLGNEPVAFARVITDYATFGYVADVFVSPEYRGHGYSKMLMDSLMQDTQLSTITKWVLITTSAHKLYEKYGFKAVKYPERYMEYLPNKVINSINKKDKNC